MNKLMAMVFGLVLGFGVMIPDSEAARRIGGGKSVGTQRQAQPQQPAQRPDAAQQAAPQAGAAAAGSAARGSRWLGPVAGLLAGGLLSAMIFGGAFEGIKFMDVLLILLLAGGLFYLFRMMRKPQAQERRHEPMQYAGAGAGVEPNLGRPLPQSQPISPAASAPAAGVRYFPAGFDADAFARQAKSNFTRMQDANDRADLAALRDMMTPALYTEIEAQIRERGGATQKTEVVTLDARVIEVVTEGDHYIASVRFTGLIRENDARNPEPFDEVWHVRKDLRDRRGSWLIAGAPDGCR